MAINFTGYPLIDAGLATITVLVGRTSLADLKPSDLWAVADDLRDTLYTVYDAASGFTAQGPFKSYLIWLFPNSVWVNNLSADPERASTSLESYVHEVLYAFDAAPPLSAPVCSFCGKPSVRRATRVQVPLLSGAYPNFGPDGKIGVPICGMCLLAIHALPLGGVAVQGRRLMVIASSNPELLIHVTRKAVRHNKAVISQARLAGWSMLPYPRTRLVAMLRAIEQEASGALQGNIDAFLLTNDNRQAGLSIYRLTSQALAFIREAEHPYAQERHAAWQRAISRAWEPGEETAAGEMTGRNVLYEDLFVVPFQPMAFLRTHLLPTRCWSLIELFARKVMGMDPDQLKLLYILGTRFAEYARQKRAFYFDFIREANYATWRRRLVGAADAMSRRGDLLITAEEFVQAFMAPAQAEFFDWRLARDIIALRMVEELARSGDIRPDDEALLPDELNNVEEV